MSDQTQNPQTEEILKEDPVGGNDTSTQDSV